MQINWVLAHLNGKISTSAQLRLNYSAQLALNKLACSIILNCMQMNWVLAHLHGKMSTSAQLSVNFFFIWVQVGILMCNSNHMSHRTKKSEANNSMKYYLSQTILNCSCTHKHVLQHFSPTGLFFTMVGLTECLSILSNFTQITEQGAQGPWCSARSFAS